jgi:hypothetical protein
VKKMSRTDYSVVAAKDVNTLRVERGVASGAKKRPKNII